MRGGKVWGIVSPTQYSITPILKCQQKSVSFCGHFLTALPLGAWACNQLCKVILAWKLQGYLISEITLCQALLVYIGVKSKFCD